VKKKSDRQLERRDAALVAGEVLKTLGPRPGGDDPDSQRHWDAIAKAAAGEVEPEPNGFDVNEMNLEFALVPMGQHAVILWEKPEAPAEERLQFLQPAAFRLIYSNRWTEIRTASGDTKWKTYAEAWLDSYHRRQYTGIEFRPDREQTEGRPGYYNLWRGFAVEPRPGGSYSIFKDHLRTNVCGEDDKLFTWLFGWFAQMVQHPREKPGTALVLRGGMGVGKTKVGQVFGSLIPAHYFHVDNPRYVLGQFNAFMGACLLLQADEAVFAGDKAVEGHLRGMVTSDFQMIESKGVDPIRLPNYVRLMMTSNEDWVIPAGKDERRFAVFDVDPRCAQQSQYFREMDEQLDDGGREALLHDLLAFDLGMVNLREIPKTAALLEQKIRSFDPIEQWLFDRLHDGTPTERHDRWPEIVECKALYDDYLTSAERTGTRFRVAKQAFGMKVNKLLPGLRRVRVTLPEDDGASVKRSWVYELPPLPLCREAFDEQVGQASHWGTEEESTNDPT
jgi:hypothetical protein